LLLGVLVVAGVSAQSDEEPRLQVIVAALNVRSGPGVSYPAMDLLWQGDEVALVGHHATTGWWQVRLPDEQVGWVTGVPAFVQVRGDTSDVPEVAAPAVKATAPVVAEPSSGGTLVFQTVSGGPIYAIQADGRNLRYLTTGLDPAISPDGQWVAFARWDHPGFGALGSVWVMNLDGSGERMVLGGIGRPKSPVWSADGQRLAFNLQLGGGHAEPVNVCNKGSVPVGAYDVKRQVLPNGDVSFCYKLPPESFWGLRIVDVATGAFEDVPHDSYAFSPVWDPANPWQLVYVGVQGLVRLETQAGTAWPLTTDFLDHSPSFSPDGQRLAVTYLQHDHWEVHVLNADGSGRVRLTETPLSSIAQQIYLGQEPQVWNNASATWSPDGGQLAFLSDRDGQWRIWVMNADGSQQRPLFSPETLAGIELEYHGMDERMISWGP
jgi:dipeptidyl aminopeptidase/acylaminoacyl peptidase